MTKTVRAALAYGGALLTVLAVAMTYEKPAEAGGGGNGGGMTAYKTGDRVAVPISAIANVAVLQVVPDLARLAGDRLLILTIDHVEGDQAFGNVVGFIDANGDEHGVQVPAGLGPFGFPVARIARRV